MISKGYEHQLNEELFLRVAKDDKDEFNKILEFNVAIHGDPVRRYLEHIYLHHPRRNEILLIYIEENSSNQIVSSIGLLPLEWKLGGIAIPVCEMGFVGTLDKYRGEGLIGKLNEIYERVMAERGYILSVIRGIPYFYRRLGYEFAMPLDHRILLSGLKIPDKDLESLKIRKANLKDIEFIRKKYEEYYNNYFVINIFDRDSFIFKYVNDDYNDFQTSLYILEENGNPLAYFTFGKSYDDLGYDIKTSKINDEMSLKILQFVKEIHGIENSSKIDLAVKEETDLSEFILNLGGITASNYAWQVRIPNLKLYFQKIKLILENRVKVSKIENLSQKVIISNYKETIELMFSKGKITEISQKIEYPQEGTCDLQIPGPMLIKLLLGDRSFDEINYIMKDARVKHGSKELINILFPKEKSFPDTYY